MDFATLFWVGMGFGALVLILHFITSVQVDHGPMRYERWHASFVMWSEQRAARRAAGMNPVYIPVSQYGMELPGMGDAAPIVPDIDAENTDMPRVSSKLSDQEVIVLLAAQRGKDNKYRYSANAIHSLVGGDRNTVLATIKELRTVAPPALYRQPDGTTAPAAHPITN
jgi:hypothetical protein